MFNGDKRKYRYSVDASCSYSVLVVTVLAAAAALLQPVADKFDERARKCEAT